MDDTEAEARPGAENNSRARSIDLDGSSPPTRKRQRLSDEPRVSSPSRRSQRSEHAPQPKDSGLNEIEDELDIDSVSPFDNAFQMPVEYVSAPSDPSSPTAVNIILLGHDSTEGESSLLALFPFLEGSMTPQAATKALAELSLTGKMDKQQINSFLQFVVDVAEDIGNIALDALENFFSEAPSWTDIGITLLEVVKLQYVKDKAQEFLQTYLELLKATALLARLFTHLEHIALSGHTKRRDSVTTPEVRQYRSQWSEYLAAFSVVQIYEVNPHPDDRAMVRNTRNDISLVFMTHETTLTAITALWQASIARDCMQDPLGYMARLSNAIYHLIANTKKLVSSISVPTFWKGVIHLLNGSTLYLAILFTRTGTVRPQRQLYQHILANLRSIVYEATMNQSLGFCDISDKDLLLNVSAPVIYHGNELRHVRSAAIHHLLEDLPKNMNRRALITSWAWELSFPISLILSTSIPHRRLGLLVLDDMMPQVFDCYQVRFNQTIDADAVSLAHMMSQMGLCEAVFREGSDALVIEHTSVTVNFLSAADRLPPQSLLTMTDFMQNSKNTLVQEACCKVLRRLVNAIGSRDQLMTILESFLRHPVEELWLPSVTLIHFTLERLSQCEFLHALPEKAARLAQAIVDLILRIHQQNDMRANLALRDALRLDLGVAFSKADDYEKLGSLVTTRLSSLGSNNSTSIGSAVVLNELLAAAPLRMTNLVPGAQLLSQSLSALRDSLSSDRTNRQLFHDNYLTLLSLVLRALPLADGMIDRSTLWTYVAHHDALDADLREAALRYCNDFARHDKVTAQVLQSCVCDYLPAMGNEYLDRSFMPLMGLTLPPFLDGHTESFTTFCAVILRAFILTDDRLRSQDLFTAMLDVVFSKALLEKPEQALILHSSLADSAIGSLLSGHESAASLLEYLLHASRRFHVSLSHGRGTSQLKRTLTRDREDSVELYVRILDVAFPDKIERWILDRNTTMDGLDSHIRKELSMKHFRVFINGQELPLMAEKSAAKLTAFLEKDHSRNLVIKRIYRNEELYNHETMDRQRSAVESRILHKYAEIYDKLYDLAPVGEQVASLLSSISYVDGNLPIRYVGAYKSLDPASQPTKWKTIHAIRTLQHALQTRNRFGLEDTTATVEGIKSLVNVLLSCSSDNIQVLSEASQVLRCYLLENIDDVACGLFLAEPALFFDRACHSLQALASLVCAEDTTQGETLRAKAALGALHDCLLEAAARNDLILDRVIQSFGTSSTYGQLFSEGHTVLMPIIVRSLERTVTTLPDSDTEDIVHGGREGLVSLKGLYRAALLKDALLRRISQSLADYTDASRIPASLLSLWANFSISTGRTLSPDSSTSDSLENLLAKLFQIADEDESSDSLHRLRLITTIVTTHAKKVRKKRNTHIVSTADVHSLLTLLFDGSIVRRGTSKIFKTVRDVQTRSFVYNLLEELCHHTGTARLCAAVVHDAVTESSIEDGDLFADRSDSLRILSLPVGLVNLNQTCYLNSLLQQLFMIQGFRQFIIDVPIVDYEDQQVLVEFKKTFANLQNSYRSRYKPDGLCKVLDIDVNSQEDAHIFFTMLMSRLEISLPDALARKTLNSFFMGHEVSQTAGSCGHISAKSSEFLNLSLTVKGHHDLRHSLADYVGGARLDEANRYRCSTCETAGRPPFVDADQRTRLEYIPDNLILGLKRFCYDSFGGAQKINDEFHFPSTIDMAPYTLEAASRTATAIEPDIFELTGILVHYGTLDHGHYWSYTKDPTSYGTDPGLWYRIEDHVATVADINAMLAEATGTATLKRQGIFLRSQQNAYVLFYRRMKSASPDDRTDGAMQPPATDEILEAVANDNYKTILQAELFDSALFKFVSGLLRTASIESEAIEGDDSGIDIFFSMAARYLVEVPCKHDSLQGLYAICQDLEELVDQDAMTARKLLTCVSRRGIIEKAVFAYHYGSREMITRLVTRLLHVSRDAAKVQTTLNDNKDVAIATSHDDVLRMLVKTLESQWQQLSECKTAWGTFFSLLVKIARQGSDEAKALNSAGFLDLAFEFLYCPYLLVYREKYPAIARQLEASRYLQWPSVLDFITYFLEHAVVFEYDDEYGSESRASANSGATAAHRQFITMANPDDSQLMLKGRSLLVHACCHLAEVSSSSGLKKNASRLLVVLMASSLDDESKDFLIDSLASLVVDSYDHEEFDARASVALLLCLSADVSAQRKNILLEGVLKEAHLSSSISNSTVDFLVGAMATMPPDGLHFVFAWIHNVFLESELAFKHQAVVLKFLQEHAFQAALEGEATLATAFRQTDELSQFIEALGLAVREHHSPKRPTLLKMAMAAIIDGTLLLQERYAPFVDIFEQFRLERALLKAGFDDYTSRTEAAREIHQIRGLRRTMCDVIRCIQEFRIDLVNLVKESSAVRLCTLESDEEGEDDLPAPEDEEAVDVGSIPESASSASLSGLFPSDG